MAIEDEDLVTVCAECLRACCWQGAHVCETWRTATTKQLRVAELRGLGLESDRYWDVHVPSAERA